MATRSTSGKKYRAFYFRGIEIETSNQHLGESQRCRVKSRHNTNQRTEEDYRKRSVSVGMLTLRGGKKGKLLKLIIKFMEVKKEFERKKKSSETKAAICHLQWVRWQLTRKRSRKTHTDQFPYTRNFMNCIFNTGGRYWISLFPVCWSHLKSKCFHFHTLLHVKDL